MSNLDLSVSNFLNDGFNLKNHLIDFLGIDKVDGDVDLDKLEDKSYD